MGFISKYLLYDDVTKTSSKHPLFEVNYGFNYYQEAKYSVVG